MTDLAHPPDPAPVRAVADLVTPHGPGADHVTVQPAAGLIGAEITGVDLTRPLLPGEVDAIRAALRTWRVVFFRDQFIDHATHIALGRQFGELTYAHPLDEDPPEGYPEIFTVNEARNRHGDSFDEETRDVVRAAYENGWHTDVTPAINPPAASILRADRVPEFGGDTQFTNLVAAYEALSGPVKSFVDELRAEHFYGANLPGAYAARVGKSFLEGFAARPLVAHHPVVRVHPETGEKLLFVNPMFTGRILDVEPSESQWILGHLFSHLAKPRFTVRFRWAPGSVAFWDNRSTAHLGPTDLRPFDRDRVLHRVTLIGDVPVGPDGHHSALIEGVPFRQVGPSEPGAA